ncbi:MAG: lysophospholipid acyltransferase family protein [Nitrospinae bacterium]|nr:lysophospholipid acyltransferase family protein [Nitrospinota bacterium]
MNEDSIAYDEWGRNPDAPLSAWLGGVVIAGYLKAVYATSSMVLPNTESNKRMSCKLGEKFIWALWHCHLGLPPFFYPDNYHLTCMASRSRDGELLAQIMSRLNTHCVRGSSSVLDGRDKGGAAAVRQMIRVAKKGEHQLVITPDGPKGPPQKVKMGVITLASLTGYPICPVAFAASRFFTIPTWDKTIFPLPFGRIAACCGEPLEVPRTRDKGVLEAKRAEIEKRLIHANEEAQYYLKNMEGK